MTEEPDEVFASLEQRAAALGFVPIRLRDLGKRQGYVALNFPSVRDPFVGISSIMRRSGRYRLTVGSIEPFMVDGDFIVWVRPDKGDQ